MISEFEQRLANVLGTRLPAPLTGRVAVAGAPVAGEEPLLVVGVRQTDATEAEFHRERPEAVPGATVPRRVLRLSCIVEIRVAPPTAARPQQVLALDAALYALGAADFLDGSVLRDGPDPGFLIREMRLAESVSPLEPAAAPAALTLRATGLFWPVGVAGQAGTKIGEIRTRGALLPVEITPGQPLLVADGPAVDLTVRLGSIGLMRISGQPAPLPPLPFGSLAFGLVGPGGRPGAGTLSGGTAGNDGIRLVLLADGSATISYTPPAEPATEELVVALDDGEGGLGVEIGRATLNVRSA